MFKDFGVLNKNSLTDRLYHLSFSGAQAVINKMDDENRKIVLAEIDELKLVLNTQMCKIDQYTLAEGYPRPLCSMSEYMFMYSMVKRLDILISMLCNVNDAIDEHDAYEEYNEIMKYETSSPKEKVDIIQQLQTWGKVLPDKASNVNEMSAYSGNINHMKKLASEATGSVYSDSMQAEAAALTKRYFERKLSIKREGK